MKYDRAIYSALAAFLFLASPLRAQFVLSGTDDARLRWKSISTEKFKLIYPTGCDSLAYVYIRELERYRPLLGASLNMTSGQYQSRPLPVVLHTQNAAPNGSVTWAPSRMELITLPEYDKPEAVPWSTMLSIHEGRHAAQMQNGYRKVFKPFRYIFGEFAPSLAAAYPGHLLLEGDAVVAETALTASGRGRSSTFLERYYYAWDTGDTRSFLAWRLGSYYKPAPNHYALGYAMISALRVKYDYPLFIEDYFDYVSRRPYDLWPLRHAMRRTTGNKFKRNFADLMQFHYDIWAADTASRAPFMPYERISRKPRYMTSYDSPGQTPYGNDMWVKKDIYHLSAVVTMDSSGKEKKLFKISSSVVKIAYEESDSILLWNELRKDPRWGQKSKTIVRKYNFSDKKLRTLTHYGEFLYPIETGADTVAAVHYLERGGGHIDFISKTDGRPYGSQSTPDSLQIVEITHVGDKIYSSAISSSGFGIWELSDGKWTNLLPPIPVQVSSLDHFGNAITFQSDLGGVLEFYRYDLQTRQLYQVSGTKYGGADFAYRENGDVIFSRLTDEGNAAFLTKAEDLLNRPVEWINYHHYPVADSLSRQERKLMTDKGISEPQTEQLSISAPQRYVKGGHALRFHSWTPFYIDFDVLNSFTFDKIKYVASLGAMCFFQNTMSTFSGHVGYKARPDASGKWFHSGHVNLTYSGLYPVFELQMHLNEREARHYYDDAAGGTAFTTDGTPCFSTDFSSYVPLDWDNGIIRYGVVPSVGLTFTNDRYRDRYGLLFNAGVRAYVVEHTPSACVYPRWGGGVQLQWKDPFTYVHAYAYTPGICCGQGLKLAATQQWLTGSNPVLVSGNADIMPRGMGDYEGAFTEGTGMTADYAVPFYMGDWHIADAFYCKRGIVTLHYDASVVRGNKVLNGGWLFSAGASFEMEFGSFLWVRTPISLGVDCSYNWGSAFRQLGASSPVYVGAIATIEI